MTRAAWIAIEAGLTAVLEGVRELLAQIPAPAPEPPSEPTPEPPAPAPPPVEPPAPVPAPPPPADLGALSTRPLNTSALLYFRAMHSGGRYTRAVPNIMLPRAAGVTIEVIIDSRVSGVDPAWHSPTYTVTCDGVSVGTFARPLTGEVAKLTADLSAVSDGWHLFDVVPSEGDETAVPFWMHVGAVQPQTWAPAQAGSFDITHVSPMSARWAQVPAQPVAIGYPLAPRQFAPMIGHPAPSAMFKRDLVPSINGDPPYLHTLQSGAKTCMSNHAYAWSGMMAKLPRIVLRDGPRGIGTVAGATHLQIGRRGGVYGLDCWRMFHVDPTGYVRTLLGWRHGPNGLEVVGDWSAIPVERHGLHEAWGFAWDLRTISQSTLDTSLLLDRGDGTMEHPHSVGPAGWIADTQNNRVLRVQFDPRDHAAPPKITEFITGLKDPFDVVYREGLIYVSERLAHRIAVFNADTGAFVEALVQGAPLSALSKDRLVVLYGTLDERRAEPCVGPEGLALLGDWLYFGSRAQQRVKRINVVTRQIEVVCDPWFDTSPGGSQYCKIAVRDDGTVFASTWENAAKGGPRAYKADGTGWALQSGASAVVKTGRSGNYADVGYSTASAVDGYRVVYSGADYGLCELSLTLPEDPPATDPTQYAAGQAEYERAGYRLTHGTDGFGQFGYALPWGQSAAIDYFLRANGHRP